MLTIAGGIILAYIALLFWPIVLVGAAVLLGLVVAVVCFLLWPLPTSVVVLFIVAVSVWNSKLRGREGA